MSYHGFARPAFMDGNHSTHDWMEWLEEQDSVLLPVSPPHDQSCASCMGAVGYMNGGPGTWSQCYNCRSYDGAVDVFVPITYSIDSGLESMLHRYKDFETYEWLRLPLAVLLNEFIEHHGVCIERHASRHRIDVATTVPPNTARSFDHLHDLLGGVVAGDPVLARWTWDLDVLSRVSSIGRPGRGRLTPAAYDVTPFVVEGSSVLLLDDTWTSGASAASAAAALKAAGASHVTVLTLGRQLNPSSSFGSTAQIYRDSAGEDWDLRDCVLCS